MNGAEHGLNFNRSKDNDIGLKVNSFISGCAQLRLGSAVSNLLLSFFFIRAFLPKPFVLFRLLNVLMPSRITLLAASLLTRAAPIRYLYHRSLRYQPKTNIGFYWIISNIHDINAPIKCSMFRSGASALYESVFQHLPTMKVLDVESQATVANYHFLPLF